MHNEKMHKELLRNRDDLLGELRQFMTSNNLSQAELSRRSGVCQPQISRILNAKSGISKRPSRKLVELCISVNIKTRNALYDPSEDDQMMTLLLRALGQGQGRIDRVKRVLKALAED
jgi:transcriptional regulator with XRE-family HTH domain